MVTAHTESLGPSPYILRGAGAAVIIILCAVCLALAFRSGAYSPAEWLPFTIGLAAVALMVIASGPRVRCTRSQKALLGLFAAQATWTLASMLWATSRANAWEEINRTLFYAVAIGLTFAAVRWAGPAGLKMLSVAVTAVAGIVALVIAIRLGVSENPAGLFANSRLSYPVTYFNGQAALLMIGFWLALGMANGVESPRHGARWQGLPRWAQPLLLALSVLLAEIALLPQSRGAFWTFFLVVPFFVILSTNRFRALVNLAIVVLPVVVFWSDINGTFVALRDDAPLVPAINTTLRAVGYSVLIVAGTWAVTYLVERLVGPLSRRMTRWIGVVLIVLAMGGAIGGSILADVRTGGLNDYLGDRWAELISDTGGAGSGEAGSRFAAMGLNGRWRQWKVATQAFKENPLLGIGAQNFELYHYEHRAFAMDVKQPHSQPMQLLAELGLPGLILWIVFVLLALVRAVVVRFHLRQRVDQAVIAAMITAALSWFIHSSADWLWQLAAVSLPALLLLGGLVAAHDPVAEGVLSLTARPIARRFRTARVLLVALALGVIVSTALPYLSLRYCNMASGAKELETMTARAETASALDPTSVQPFAVRATAYRIAAGQEPDSSHVRVEYLMNAGRAWVEATEIEPGSWLCFYKAAEMYAAAGDAAIAADSTGSEGLLRWARTYLDEARRLNPLSPEITALDRILKRQ